MLLVVLYTVSPQATVGGFTIWLHRVGNPEESIVPPFQSQQGGRDLAIIGTTQPWLPHEDRLSYSESLRDSGVSRT